MSKLEQRLENLENSSGHGEMSHDDWVLHWMDKPSLSNDDSPEITDADIEAFLRPATNRPESSHAKP